ncbi:lipopolysaccharide biosynthesis protein [Pedobacter aquatilis]|uniref:lipopolysaccharide biosynthesis protein n=1 Tax=Pedobacter aquatilis TaxID=351343 RepID=UPI00292F0DBF|nr:oligosaccharide flippase family protein [Pedobacter aquatilis]
MSIIKKIFSSFKNIHFQSLIGNGVMAGFGMLTVAILYRALSFKDIGIYIFFTTILALIDTLRSGFLTNSFIKFYSGTAIDRANEVSGSGWALGIAITLFSIALNIPSYFLSSLITNEGMILFLKYFSLISIATLPSFMANLVVQGDKRFDRLLWMRLINQVLFTGTIIVLVIIKQSSLNAVLITYVLSNLLSSIIILLLGWSKIGTLKYSSKTAFMELFHFGKYSMATSVSANLFHVTDTFFINFYLGPAALAIYNLSGKLLQIIEMPLLSFAASGMPSLSAHYNNGKKAEMMYVMKKMVGMLSIVILVVALCSVAFANPIIALIGGEKYLTTEAPNLFRILMCMAVLYPADRFFSLGVDVIHLPKINFYKILVMLAANLIGDFVGVAIFHSIYGIAIANILPIIIAIWITYKPLNNYYNFNFWSVFTVGFNEIIVFLKHIYSTFFFKSKNVNH